MWNLGYSSNSVTCLIWLSLWLLNHPVIVEKKDSEGSEIIYSSVWCYSSDFGRKCSFRNLCYDPNINSFLFIINKRTIISGIKARYDLKEISSSWLNHSHFYLNIVLVDSIKNFELIRKRTVIMTRFKPDNIMHVIHDDLIPLYITYKRICLSKIDQCSTETLIAFVDASNSSFHKLYKAFSIHKPIFLQTVKSITCFSVAHVGLDSDGIFYQYGYTKPHGPIMPTISGEFLYEFSEYILNYLKIKRNSSISKSTFIGRLINRRILNEKFFVDLIKDLHIKKTNEPIFVDNVDINSLCIKEVIRSVASSKLLVGMHGAGMLLAIFLPRGAIAMELFPYGIVKEYVSALYSLSRIKGVYFGYLSWTNFNKDNTLRHPEYPRLLGGLGEITDSEKNKIFAATQVPPVHCCHDPMYLHFMYQDTFIDQSILPVILESFKTHSVIDAEELMYKQWFYPSQVRNINCSPNKTQVFLSWDPPVNIKNLSEILYIVTLSSSKHNSTFVTKMPSLSFKLSFNVKLLLVWIQCKIKGVEGTDSHFICNL